MTIINKFISVARCSTSWQMITVIGLRVAISSMTLVFSSDWATSHKLFQHLAGPHITFSIVTPSRIIYR